MYKGFKITSIIIASLAILIEFVLIFSAIPDAIDSQTLTGGARAQAEFFAMPLFFVGGSFAIVCLGLLISNSITDTVRAFRRADMYPKNLLTYCLLVVAILLPMFGTFGLTDLMYSGWK